MTHDGKGGRRRRLGFSRSSELRGLAGDSFYVAIWQGAISVADLVQIALVTHMLGLEEFGRLALVLSFVTLVGQFFDVRVAVAATTFGARALSKDTRRAAGVFQFSYVIDGATGLVGFLVVAALAPLVGPALIGDGGTGLILLFALTLLVSTVDESSIAILRLLGRFRLVAGYTVMLEALRVALIAYALYEWRSLTAVLGALLVADLLAGIANFIAARRCFEGATRVSLLRPAMAAFKPARGEFLRMVLHTNVVSYSRIAQTQLPAIMLGALAGATATGIYKVGMAVAAAVGRIADPAYAALLPRIARLWSANQHDEVRHLVKRATFISIPVMMLALVAVVLLRSPILTVLGGGEEATAAGNVAVLGAAGMAISGALFWNIGVLFTTGHSALVSHIALLGAGLQLALLAPLILTYEADGAALAFFVSIATTNLVAGWLALRKLSGRGRPSPQPTST